MTLTLTLNYKNCLLHYRSNLFSLSVKFTGAKCVRIYVILIILFIVKLSVPPATQARNKRLPDKRESCLAAYLEMLCYNDLNYKNMYGNATDLF